jgi:ABC-type transporter Mla subunit MlaD
MTGTFGLRMQPAEVIDAAQQLDQLAGRADKLMQAEMPNLAVTAPGRDDVSQRVASTLNDVHDEFRKVTDRGANEIRGFAASLRAHTDNILAAEGEFAV